MGGNEPLTFALKPDSSGLTFYADARTWSGKPTAEVVRRTMTYRATDPGGHTALLAFDLTVLRGRPPPPIECLEPKRGLSRLRDAPPDLTESASAPGCAVMPAAGPRAERLFGSNRVAGREGVSMK